MTTCSWRTVACWLVLYSFQTTLLRAAELRGQVTEVGNGLPIEGAAIVLTNNSATYHTESDPFGFYTISGITSGSYTTRVLHAGYLPVVETNGVGPSDDLHKNFFLAPALGGEGAGFDLFFQVTDAGTGVRLKDVPVTAQRFELFADAVPTDTRVVITDSNGLAVVRGNRTGFYRFKANVDGSPRARWLSYTTEGKTNDKPYLIKDHMANFMLKPGPLQDLTVIVKGFDPRTQSNNVPLANIAVELSGRDPGDVFAMVRPPETGVTDTNGSVTFKNLPALPALVRTKKVGYGPKLVLLNPTNAAADLLPNPLTITNDLDPSMTILWLQSPYADNRMMTGLVVTVRGLKGTDTEGIFRANISKLAGPKAVAEFPNLIPGRYLAAVHSPKVSPAREAMDCEGSLTFTAHFDGQAYFDHQGQPFKEVPLMLDPLRATVRLRLFAADEQGKTPTQLEGDAAERPIYKLRQQDNIRIIEHYFDPLLLPTVKTNIVATGPDGTATLSIVPGCYGIVIPGMTNHTGSEVLYRDETVASVAELGWPYPVWTDTYSRVEGRHACGLLFDSGHEYSLDLFTRRRQVDLHGDVDGDTQAPTTFRILANPGTASQVEMHYSEIANNGGAVSLTGTNGTLNDLAAAVDGTGSGADYRFEKMGAGTYALAITHPRHATMTGSVFIAAWRAPGELPSVAPATAGDYEALTTIELPVKSASYATSNIITLEVYKTNNLGSNVLDHITTQIDVVEPGHVPNKFFDVSGTSPSRLPSGSFDFWRNFPPFGWFAGSASGTTTNLVYLDGPLVNVSSNDAPPVPGYTLNIIAKSADDPDLVVGNVLVTLPNAQIVSTPITLTSHTNGFIPTAVTHALWTWHTNGTKYEVEINSHATPEFTLTLWMKRGMGVSGTVVNADMPTNGLTNVYVVIRDRFGRKLRDATTTSNGAFKLATALPAGQTVFADISVPGFQPWRQRYVPDPAAGSTDVVVTASLKPIPLPVIQTAEFNRFGVFLPGVLLSGSQAIYNGLIADAPLTVTWTASVVQAVFTNIMPSFDTPSGATGVLETLVVTDAVTEVWLVDKRYFPTNAYGDAPLTNAPPSATNGYAAMRAWLKSASSSTSSNRFMRRVTTAVSNGTSVGSAKLYDFPPGDFDPVFVALSDAGGVAVYDYDFPNPANQWTLKGLRLPPWAATVLDVLSIVAGTQKTEEQLEAILPEGRFEALPSFTTDITEDAGFLTYAYEMGVNWDEGMDTPMSGILSLAPGEIGLSFEGKMNFEVDGLNGNATMAMTADFATKDVEITKMMPKVVGKYAEVSGKLKAGAESTYFQSFTMSQEMEFELSHEVGGGFAVNARANLQPALGKIPYVGPVLTALDKIEGLQFFGLLEGGVGQESQIKWQTYRPLNYDETSSDTNQHLQMRHLLGGKNEVYVNRQLCFRFGAGLSVEAAGGRAGATGNIVMQGNECGRQPAPAASITYNVFPDWPPITRVEGNVTASVEAYLKAWVLEVGKSWEWDVIAFDIQFGTEPVFQLIQMNVSKSQISPASPGVPAVAFSGTAPQLANNFYGAGSFSAAAGTANAMTFTDIDPLSSSMVVRVSTWNGTNWNAPSSLTATGGIITLALAQMTNGAWMAAWNEMDHYQVGLMFPSTRLMYATSDVAVATWSVPSLIASLPGAAASELRLVKSGPFLGLLSLETDQGPLAKNFTMKGRVWNGATWTLPGGSTTNLTIRGFDAAGANTGALPRVKIAYTDGTGILKSISWDGSTFAAPTNLTNNAANALALCADTNGTFLLSWAANSGGISFFRCDTNNLWTSIGTVFSNGLPLELGIAPLAATGGTRFLVSWIESGAARSIWYGFVDDSGAVHRAATDLTQNKVGRYHDLALLPSTNWTARIVSLFTASPTQLREFTVGLNEGNSLNDADADGFNDLLELIIVDASTNDAITNIANVSATADFDGDGTANHDEFYLGFDPTDPLSAFAVQDFTRTNAPTLFFYAQTNRTYWLQRSPTLLDANAWTNLHSVTGDADFVSTTDTNAPGTNFHYRITTPVPSPAP